MLYKMLDYVMPLLGGVIFIIIALLGYPKAKNDPKKKRQNILYLILGIFLVVFSLSFIFFIT
jgi:membrane protein insertase Oxa1/YidC/SpoIIIJ